MLYQFANDGETANVWAKNEKEARRKLDKPDSWLAYAVCSQSKDFCIDITKQYNKAKAAWAFAGDFDTFVSDTVSVAYQFLRDALSADGIPDGLVCVSDRVMLIGKNTKRFTLE